jgi:dTDP-4-amino-4,6-dideoxygalactose transaminase
MTAISGPRDTAGDLEKNAIDETSKEPTNAQEKASGWPMVTQNGPLAAYLARKEEIDGAITRVLMRGSYILGKEVAEFEREFAAYVGVAHAIGVANGTEALEIALRACGIGSGDSVITVSHTAVATVAAIDLAGAIPVLVDVHPQTYTMDPNFLEDAVRQHGHGG